MRSSTLTLALALAVSLVSAVHILPPSPPYPPGQAPPPPPPPPPKPPPGSICAGGSDGTSDCLSEIFVPHPQTNCMSGWRTPQHSEGMGIADVNFPDAERHYDLERRWDGFWDDGRAKIYQGCVETAEECADACAELGRDHCNAFVAVTTSAIGQAMIYLGGSGATTATANCKNNPASVNLCQLLKIDDEPLVEDCRSGAYLGAVTTYVGMRNECFEVVDDYQDQCAPFEAVSVLECQQYYEYLIFTGEAVNPGGMQGPDLYEDLPTGCSRIARDSYTDVYYNSATSDTATVDVFRVCRCIHPPPPPSPPPPPPPTPPPMPPRNPTQYSKHTKREDSTILVAVLLTAIPIVALGLIGYVAFLFYRHPKQPASRATGNAPTLVRAVPVPTQDKGQFSFHL